MWAVESCCIVYVNKGPINLMPCLVWVSPFLLLYFLTYTFSSLLFSHNFLSFWTRNIWNTRLYYFNI
uniref:Uncharacterized protein n=1 Tax=Solanum lycopersicum TaxID=4081 RepID=A0A3Q7J342_SOLLC